MTLPTISNQDPSDSAVALAPATHFVVVVAPSGKPRVVGLDPYLTTTVGTSPTNALVLEAEGLSPHHFGIVPSQDGYRLVGIETYNDLYLNGRHTTEAALSAFDRIRFSGFELVFLPASVDPNKVAALLATPDEETQGAVPQRGTGHLRENLLWLLLISQDLPPGADTEPVLELLLDEALRWTGYEVGILLIKRPGSQRLAPRCAAGLPLMQEELASVGTLVHSVIDSGQTYAGPSPLPRGGRVLCVPVSNLTPGVEERRKLTLARVEGVLLLSTASETPPSDLAEEQRELLQALTRQMANILGNARMFRQATTDKLTGLATRGCTERVLEEEIAGAASPVSVLLIDVDDFKRVNDQHGHATGDRVLKDLGERLRAALRSDDFAGRWGGEEFLAVLPATDLEGACAVAENVLRSVSTLGGSEVPAVSVSIGVSTYPLLADEADALVANADAALYTAKDEGKARYVVATRGQVRPHRPRAAQPPTRIAEQAPLLELRGPLVGSLPLRPGTYRLGRDAEADLQLPHRTVSRAHGTLHVDARLRVQYRDSSTNGSYLNEALVFSQRDVDLLPNDELRIGPFQLQLVRRDPNTTPQHPTEGDAYRSTLDWSQATARP